MELKRCYVCHWAITYQMSVRKFSQIRISWFWDSVIMAFCARILWQQRNPQGKGLTRDIVSVVDGHKRSCKPPSVQFNRGKRQRVQLREKEGALEKWESPLRVQFASGARVRDGGKCFSLFCLCVDIHNVCVFCISFEQGMQGSRWIISICLYSSDWT